MSTEKEKNAMQTVLIQGIIAQMMEAAQAEDVNTTKVLGWAAECRANFIVPMAVEDEANPDNAMPEAAEEAVDLTGDGLPDEEDQDMMREDEGHQPTAEDENPTVANGTMEED